MMEINFQNKKNRSNPSPTPRGICTQKQMFLSIPLLHPYKFFLLRSR